MPASAFRPFSLAVRLALRDFRGGLGGFFILIACLTLGLMAIVGVGSITRSLAQGLVEKGRIILGGDISFDLIQREATPGERAVLASYGNLSRIALIRAMARSADAEVALIEMKAVDASYPVAGQVGLNPPQDLASLLAFRDGAFGVAADSAFAARLNLKPGARFKVGVATFALRAILTSEPDKLAAGVGFGPRVIVSDAALRATKLLQPGALVRWLYRLSLRPDETPEAVRAAVRKALPSAGFDIRTWKNVSPEFSRDLDRFSQFLILVGLSALLIGGVGVANASTSFVERKTETIATLKALGASGFFVFFVMLIEVLAMASIGMAAGIALGVALPFALNAAFAAFLPFPFVPGVFPGEIGAGLIYGTLTVLAFALLPLGRAHDVPVSALFRDEIAPEKPLLKPFYLVLFALAAGGLALSVLVFSPDRKLALVFIVASLGAFALLRGAATLIMRGAKKIRPRDIELRLAIANLHRPGALTPVIILSLGLGLTLIVALTLIDGNLHALFNRGRTGAVPDFFFLGVEKAQTPAFRDFVLADAPGGQIEIVPMLRGRIVRLKGQPAESVKISADAAWALQGDRGITVAATLPAGSKLVAGRWWPQNYAGPPEVSIAADIAAGLGLGLGDSITVNVLGREIEARIVSLRKVDWTNLGINFVLVFSPATFAGAPYSNLATLAFTTPPPEARERRLVRDIAMAYPDVVSLRLKDALEAVRQVVDELAAAVRGAAAVALLAATLVLAGALAAGQRARLYDVVVLKVLGATRRRLIVSLICEFGLIGAAAALFGVVAGSAAALAVVQLVMKLDFVWLWPQALVAAAVALIAAVALGLFGTWRILGRKPAETLRNL
ncbi:glycosyl transferase family 1 [Methylovirgula ligni]|uniref:Putative ABC transport system permease protein n=1 Tax=Methylovirgula ligni TaxID=569860 RepID=A0A3D9YXM9_9HYPH|nr:FtsX-like permease family protein [Methylovirgula ligni]QAY94604.1 glycosyl transferase family 1 [Methylovirgula ligni]REF87524.1 putative ABC transport system permease protein [Methylovirgula ligni]